MKARGVFAPGTLEVAESYLQNFDFLIAETGVAFHKNVQTAYDVGIPCIYFRSSNPIEKAQASGYDPDGWENIPGSSNDLDSAMADIFVSPVSGSAWNQNRTKRAIHGIILDCSTTNTNATWLTGYATWLLDKLWSNVKIPNYVYMIYSLIEGSNPSYTGSEKTIIQTFLLNQKNISTVSASSTLDDDLLPTSTIKLPYTDSVNCPWYFRLYYNDSGCFWTEYNGTKEDLYDSLGYEYVESSDDDTGDSTGGSTGDSGRTTTMDDETKQAILEIRDMLKSALNR